MCDCDCGCGCGCEKRERDGDGLEATATREAPEARDGLTSRVHSAPLSSPHSPSRYSTELRATRTSPESEWQRSAKLGRGARNSLPALPSPSREALLLETSLIPRINYRSRLCLFPESHTTPLARVLTTDHFRARLAIESGTRRVRAFVGLPSSARLLRNAQHLPRRLYRNVAFFEHCDIRGSFNQ